MPNAKLKCNNNSIYYFITSWYISRHKMYKLFTYYHEDILNNRKSPFTTDRANNLIFARISRCIFSFTSSCAIQEHFLEYFSRLFLEKKKSEEKVENSNAAKGTKTFFFFFLLFLQCQCTLSKVTNMFLCLHAMKLWSFFLPLPHVQQCLYISH